MAEPDRIEERLRAVEDEVNRTLTAPGVNRVDLGDLFPASFMREHTRFDSIEAFVREASLDPPGDEPVTPVIDDFVRGTTDFASWSEMRQQAEITWMRREFSDRPSGDPEG